MHAASLPVLAACEGMMASPNVAESSRLTGQLVPGRGRRQAQMFWTVPTCARSEQRACLQSGRTSCILAHAAAGGRESIGTLLSGTGCFAVPPTEKAASASPGATVAGISAALMVLICAETTGTGKRTDC